jgi:hypothetical protein
MSWICQQIYQRSTNALINRALINQTWWKVIGSSRSTLENELRLVPLLCAGNGIYEVLERQYIRVAVFVVLHAMPVILLSWRRPCTSLCCTSLAACKSYAC